MENMLYRSEIQFSFIKFNVLLKSFLGRIGEIDYLWTQHFKKSFFSPNTVL